MPPLAGDGTEVTMDTHCTLDDIKRQAQTILKELMDVAKLQPKDILIVGCSSSEITGYKIGSHSSEEVGRAVFEALHSALEGTGIYLAAQCCEHLNRALILEMEASQAHGFQPVNVVPQLKAGGSFATAAYHGFSKPVAVEHIVAQAGIDIGDTLIGMHMGHVAVPVRTSLKSIGEAHVVCARVRPKYIGGPRAAYDERLM